MKIEDKIYQPGTIEKLTQNQSNTPEKVKENENTQNHNRIEASQSVSQDAVVEISRNSSEAQMIRRIIETLPDVREDKVSMLKDQIQNGQYEIDHEEVADKLVDTFIEETF